MVLHSHLSTDATVDDDLRSTPSREVVPESDIEGCARAHDRLRAAVARLSDPDLRTPSQLPGWSVAHVLTHLARNAESMWLRIDAASRDEMVEQYAGGVDGREAAIAAGARRSRDEIVHDLDGWCARLDAQFGSLPADVWDRPVRTVSGGDHPVSQLPFRRWREVEVHLADVGLGHASTDWSPEFVARALPSLLTGLGTRVDHRGLAAWLLGRGPAPQLDAWG